MTAHNRPIQRACDLAGISRSTWYYTSQQSEREQKVSNKLKELAERKPTRGFDFMYSSLKNEGYPWSRSLVLRVYRKLGLRLKVRKKRSITPTEDRRPMQNLTSRNEVWACDFLTDALNDGRMIRVMVTMDEYSREALGVEAGISFPANRVCRTLDEIAEVRGGYPKCLRSDNGPEFLSKAIETWCEAHNVYHHRIQPGRPMENGRIERLNRTIREDVLDYWKFNSLSQVNKYLTQWQEEYNEYHPHKALGRVAPRAFCREKELKVVEADRPQQPSMKKETTNLLI